MAGPAIPAPARRSLTERAADGSGTAVYHDALRRLRVAVPALLALVIVCTTLLRLPSFFEPHWYGDEGIFAAIGQSILDGRLLYAEAWDNKPPLIFLVYAGVLAIFGESIPALRAAATVAVVATQVCLFHIARPAFGQARALIAPALFGAFMAYPSVEGQLTLTEGFMVAFSSGAVLLFLRLVSTSSMPPLGLSHAWKRWAAVGLLLGIATAFKPVAAMDALAVLVAVAVLGGSDRWRRAGLVMAGAAVPWLLFTVWFAAAGAFAEFVDANIGYQLRYVAASERPPMWKWLMAGPVIGGLVLVIRGRARREAFIPLWLSLACVGAMVGGLQYNHYAIQLLPPLALAASALPLPSLRVWHGWRREPLAMVVAGSASAVVALGVATAVMTSTTLLTEEANEFVDLYYDGFREAVRSRDISRFHDSFGGGWTFTRYMASEIEGRAHGDDVLIWADRAWLYPLTGTKPVSRFVVDYHVSRKPPREDELLRMAEQSPPAFVFIERSRYLPGGLEAYLRDHYRCDGDDHLLVCERADAATRKPSGAAGPG